MNKKLPLTVAGLVASLALYSTSLLAADAPAATPPAGGNTTAKSPSGVTPPAADALAKLAKPATTAGLTWDKDVAPILKASCTACHSSANGMLPKAGFDVTSLATVLKKDRKGNSMIVSGHADQSPLVWYVSDIVDDMKMPLPAARIRATDPVKALTPEQIGIVEAWINQGCKEK